MSYGSHVLTGMHTLHINLYVNAPCTLAYTKKKEGRKSPSQVEKSPMTYFVNEK